MGSFKTNGREQGPKGRRTAKPGKRRGFPRLEVLEERQLLSGGTPWHPTSTNLADVQNGPMANLGSQLINLYEAFQGGPTSVELELRSSTPWSRSRTTRCSWV